MIDPDPDLVVAAAILGVEMSCTTREIRTAFRARANLLHPDRHQNASDNARHATTAAMQQLKDAYDLLMVHAEAKEPAEVFADTPEPATYWWRCPACSERFMAESDQVTSCSSCGTTLRTRSTPDAASRARKDENPVASGPPASKLTQDFIKAAAQSERDRRRRAWLREQEELADIRRKERQRRG